MKFLTILTTLGLAAQANAACARVPDAQGNALTHVEPCPVERNSEGVPTGRLLCAESNAWISAGGNWGASATTTDQAVTFRIVPASETGTLDPIYYTCSAGTDGEFVFTREGSGGAASASIVA